MQHWSECRLDWSASYELNELRAEIGSARMATFVRIPNTNMRRNHDKYLAGWIKAMREDFSLIFTVAEAASAGAD